MLQFTIKNYADFQSAVTELCDFLAAQALPSDCIFDSKLVVHELLSNVLQHAQGGATLRVELTEENVRIFVRGEEYFCPPTGSLPDLFSERGRGLYLVDKLSVERTVTETGEILVLLKR